MTNATLNPDHTAFLLNRWQQIVDDPQYQDARVETDRDGNLIMSPHPESEHNKAALQIWKLLDYLLPGDGAYGELEVVTDAGIKVPDVMWLNPSRATEHIQKPIIPAPDICVEIASPSNTMANLFLKRDAYFRAGAREVWICRDNQHIDFFNTSAQVARSEICPKCPSSVKEIRQRNNQPFLKRMVERLYSITPKGRREQPRDLPRDPTVREPERPER